MVNVVAIVTAELDRLAEAAPFHVQVEILERSLGEPGEFARVDGQVARVFRGHLRVGERVRFEIAVYRRPDEITPGGWSWIDVATFEAARFVEAFLEGEPPDLNVANFRVRILSELGDAPDSSNASDPPPASAPKPSGLERFRRWLAR